MEEETLIIVALAAVLLLLFISYLVAKKFYEIALMKGHDSRAYFHFCFWLGMIGYLMVIALPERKTQKESLTAPQERSKDISQEKKSTAPRYPSVPEWKCSCGRNNYGYTSTCACGKNKP